MVMLALRTGEEWKFIQKYLKENISWSRQKQSKIHTTHGLCECCASFAQHNMLCCANFAQAWSSCLLKAISSSFQLQIVHGLKSWILDFLSFEMVYSIFLLAAYVGQLQKEIHLTVQKGCEITSQQNGDFAALYKMLPSARSDWIVMAVTSSFQLRIAHCLKHWIIDFLSFEMVYSMHHLDFKSNLLEVVVHHILIGGMVGLGYRDGFPMLSALVCVCHDLRLSSSHDLTKLLYYVVYQP
ncbi:hypothetical protein AAG906_015534 [Vitis piasezkii]